jgi:hypothetical protein
MAAIKRKKCRNCKELFIPDPRNLNRQKYCRKPECRSASKKASQRRWLAKPENRGYFSGPQNVRRVQLWREDNPGYWRRKPKNRNDALQDPLNPQPVENKADNDNLANDALQDFLIEQPPVLLGLIANFTGTALQDNMVMTLRRLQKLGQDIVTHSTQSKGGHYGIQGSHRCRTDPQSPRPVQLDRSPPGP